MNNRLSHIIAAVYDRPWFLEEAVLQRMGRLITSHVEGVHLTADEIREQLDAAAARNGPRGGPRVVGDIAQIAIYGMIFPRANLMTDMSGGTTVASVREAFRQAMADDTIGSILLEFDSPGGYTDGIEELATEIRVARGSKPIVAIANYGMASAAYYLGSQADEVVASPSSRVGWIGTVTIHQEFSKADEMAGVTTTIFRDPPGKYAVNEYEPISEDGAAELQRTTGDYSNQFINAVAKGRDVPVATVKADYGQGGGMTAARAKAAGLVDRVDTLDGTLRRMAQGKITMRGTQATTSRNSLQLAPIHGSDGLPTDDPDALASGEAGTPPDRSLEAQAALALARAQVR